MSSEIMSYVRPVAAVAGIVLAIGVTAVSAQEGRGGVAVNPSGEIVKNPYGECWRNQYATQEMLPEECGGPCMDSDGDGVCDKVDKCPGTAPGVQVDADGCEIKAPPPPPPMKKTEQIVIDQAVLFDFDSDELRPEARDFLDAKFAKYKGHPDIARVVITGHTDSTGPEDYNQGLSERRANAVRDYLVSAGARANVLEARGAGEMEPVASNDTREGRAQNRRVVFDVIMK